MHYCAGALRNVQIRMQEAEQAAKAETAASTTEALRKAKNLLHDDSTQTLVNARAREFALEALRMRRAIRVISKHASRIHAQVQPGLPCGTKPQSLVISCTSVVMSWLSARGSERGV